MKSAKVTISRVQGGDGQHVSIAIDDDDSGLGVIRVRISLESLAKCITGQGYIPAQVERWIGERAHLIGMTREDRTVLLDGKAPYEKSEAAEWVRAHAGLDLSDGWLIHDDGTTSRQDTPGKHRIHLCRYVPAVPGAEAGV